MTIWLLRSNIQATLPCSPRLPPFFENTWRISLTVRLRLSVATYDQHGRAAGSVAFEHDFVDLAAFELAGAAHDGLLDVVGGHTDGLGRHDRRAQARIRIRIAAVARGDHDFLDDAREQLFRAWRRRPPSCA